jgi:hypothetical protein
MQGHWANILLLFRPSPDNNPFPLPAGLAGASAGTFVDAALARRSLGEGGLPVDPSFF